MTPRPDNRERILATALELLSAGSYHTVTVDDIAGAAGVSKGGIFHHFDSKFELASTAVFEATARQWETIQATAEHIEDPAERLRHAIDSWLDMAMAPPALSKLIWELTPELMQHAELLQKWMPLLRQMEMRVAEWMGECGIPEPELKAMLLVATVDDLSIQGAFLVADEAGPSAEDIKRTLFETYVGNYIQEGRTQ